MVDSCVSTPMERSFTLPGGFMPALCAAWHGSGEGTGSLHFFTLKSFLGTGGTRDGQLP